ncbi:hypothetical protein AB9E33_33995, partial [Rhizobium leguminosarum]|uniref:hypothetical protein n=1 Tax=Rhizobium leguminosarum TaxID=384 RepID=UPI003F95B1C4
QQHDGHGNRQPFEPAHGAHEMLLTVIAMAIVGKFMANDGMGAVEIALLLIMFSVPASEGETGLFNTLLSFFVTPARLVGYEFK